MGRGSKPAELIGTQSADRIRASGHARRVEQAGHMSAPDRADLSDRNPLRGGGRSLIAAPPSRLSLHRLPGSRFSPRSARAAATSGPVGKRRHCKVHNGLTLDHVPTAATAQLPAPSPRGDTLVRKLRTSIDALRCSMRCPAEWLPGPPDAVQDNRQLASQGYTRLAWAGALLDGRGPVLQVQRSLDTMKDHHRGLVHERARESVATPGDASAAIGLAGLVAAWRETEVRTHRSRSRKSAGVFNSADIHQGGERTDARHRHQKTADRVRPNPLLHRLIEDCDLLAQLPPSGEQRAHDQADFGSAFEQRLDAPIKSEPPTGAGQQAEGSTRRV